MTTSVSLFMLKGDLKPGNNYLPHFKERQGGPGESKDQPEDDRKRGERKVGTNLFSAKAMRS